MQVKVINTSPHALPSYQTEHAAGMDLRAFLTEPVRVPTLGRVLIPTGLYLEIPPGYEAQVRPRSGLAIRQGLTVLNSPGTIDADYRGEVKVALVNLSDQEVTIADGDRIAQIVFARYEQAQWQEVEQLSDTVRGTGGFGSTGHQ
ncbi:dUTP pyrophosphatase [Catalinimonas alkaloidigena]|uniref:Deoxyuridine 5'-triphosphate nucleotidohydrolase n=1 Tax=Catalinimonas alkaloidigena TaxID=1075417 RepID=A0A1G9DW67_9BACT|nr:dUTP diphosphatase [Catalinimonas alkaloidigena]SDK68088.1 dUTP pyrophosphatase [Catalinimonas alkaloidigena]